MNIARYVPRETTDAAMERHFAGFFGYRSFARRNLIGVAALSPSSGWTSRLMYWRADPHAEAALQTGFDVRYALSPQMSGGAP